MMETGTMIDDMKAPEQPELHEETASEEERLEFFERIRKQEHKKIAEQYDNEEKRLKAKKIRMEEKYGKDLVESKLPYFVFTPWENQYSELLREIVNNADKETTEHEQIRNGEVDFYFDSDGNTAIPYFREDYTYLDLIYQLPSTSADQTFGRYRFASPSQSSTDMHAPLSNLDTGTMDVINTADTKDSSPCSDELKENETRLCDLNTSPTDNNKQPKEDAMTVVEPVTTQKKTAKENMLRRFGKWVRKHFSCCRKIED